MARTKLSTRDIPKKEEAIYHRYTKKGQKMAKKGKKEGNLPEIYVPKKEEANKNLLSQY